MTIQTYGADKRLPVCKKCLKEFFALSGKDLFPDVERVELLPIPTVAEAGVLRGTDVPLSSLGGRGTVTVGYAVMQTIVDEITSHGGRVIDVSKDLIFLSENAHFTAQGTLGYLLTTANRVPADLRAGIVGYGRIGRELVRELLFLGAKIKVFSTKMETCKTLGRVGVDAVQVGGDCPPADFSGLDILINTAPAKNIITEQSDLAGVRVIELASGENLPYGLAYETLRGVPTAMFPDSAGRALCRSVLRMMGGMTSEK
ncbi:MAG: hypothetical protein MJ082_00585 [Clostridia bacterium]|nr:hypothetical protein [Clostridia bacterium]